MPDLNFEVVGVEAPAFAATPILLFKLRIDNGDTQQDIFSIYLRCQIQINVNHRRYNAESQVKLLDLFGEPSRWGDTLRPLLWTHANIAVPQFSDTVLVDLPVPCTYDFEVASTKYFNALDDGDIPLTFLFSGTIFYRGNMGSVQVGQISWSKEALYRLPVKTWQEMMHHYFPNTTWIRLSKDVFDQLNHYKTRLGVPTWDMTMTQLLQASGEEVNS